MKTKMILLLTILTTAIAACSKTSSGAADANASASGTLTVLPMSTILAPGGTTTVSVTGGSGVYSTVTASQGTMIQAGANTWTFTAPATFTSSQVTFTAYDSLGAQGYGFLSLTGTATSTGTTTGTLASCAGTYTATIGTLNGQLYVVQNASNQIGGYIYLSQYNYYYPILGTCSMTSGANGGTMNFTNLSLNQSYSATMTNSGGQLVLQGQVATSSGNVAWTAYSGSLSAAPVAETLACDGTYTATIGSNTGTLRLVHNGSGTVAGYLNLQNYLYAFTGTCGATISLRNVTNNSNYTGTATFSGSSVVMSGSFTTGAGQSYAWSARK